MLCQPILILLNLGKTLQLHSPWCFIGRILQIRTWGTQWDHSLQLTSLRTISTPIPSQMWLPVAFFPVEFRNSPGRKTTTSLSKLFKCCSNITVKNIFDVLSEPLKPQLVAIVPGYLFWWFCLYFPFSFENNTKVKVFKDRMTKKQFYWRSTTHFGASSDVDICLQCQAEQSSLMSEVRTSDKCPLTNAALQPRLHFLNLQHPAIVNCLFGSCTS